MGLHKRFQKDRARWDRERQLLHKPLEDLRVKLVGVKDEVVMAECWREEAEVERLRAGEA